MWGKIQDSGREKVVRWTQTGRPPGGQTDKKTGTDKQGKKSSS